MSKQPVTQRVEAVLFAEHPDAPAFNLSDKERCNNRSQEPLTEKTPNQKEKNLGMVWTGLWCAVGIVRDV